MGINSRGFGHPRWPRQKALNLDRDCFRGPPNTEPIDILGFAHVKAGKCEGSLMRQKILTETVQWVRYFITDNGKILVVSCIIIRWYIHTGVAFKTREILPGLAIPDNSVLSAWQDSSSNAYIHPAKKTCGFCSPPNVRPDPCQAGMSVKPLGSVHSAHSSQKTLDGWT